MTETTTVLLEPVASGDESHDLLWVPAPCQKACPVGTDVPSYIGLIWEGKFEEALEAITATNPFSSICGRVCSMPCETECRRAESDGPVAIRALKRFVVERLGSEYRLPSVAPTTGRTVGIVGGGPTGLTAAQDLARMGHEVHVYESGGRLGGMMYQIPEFRLPRDLIDSDIDRLLAQCPGIQVHLNCALGTQTSMAELKERHDVVLLAIGLWRDRSLDVPGEEEGLAGLYGIDMLEALNRAGGSGARAGGSGRHKGENVSLTGRAVVVGGGNVAMDMARACLRLGAEEVQVYCLEARSEMPAWEHEIEDAEKEGITIHPSWGPKQIRRDHGRVTGLEFMRCTSVFDATGSFRPEYDRDETMEVDAGAVVLAIGLDAVSDELDGLGLLQRGRVSADFGNMRTADPQVFAAGDGAFGPSSIVHAMNHGHRVAHYMHAFLQGEEAPAPYATPHLTRRVPVAQDPLWEKLSREEPAFHGFDPKRPVSAASDSTFDLETARRQAARCLRCDAETGSANYSRRIRESIRAMSQTPGGDVARLRDVALGLLRPRENPFPEERPAHIDDIVFLSAALTRLVIDPYREACSSETVLGESLVLEQPFLCTGFDDAPSGARQSLSLALRASGCAYIGRRPLAPGAPGDKGEGGDVPWLQLVLPGGPDPDPSAAALVYNLGGAFRPVDAQRLRPDQLLGLSVASPALEEAIPFALEQGLDLLLLDGTAGIEKPWPELAGEPDLTVLRDVIRILRDLDREEEIPLVYFGGMRSGTDVAKVLAVNCSAAVLGVAAGLAAGGVIKGHGLEFDTACSLEERREDVANWIAATAQETAIIARCTGKTNVHNLEPEDMRSITLATSEAMGIPLASGVERRERF